MLRDYISSELQKAQHFIEEIGIHEQNIREKKGRDYAQERKNEEQAAEQKREKILKSAHSPETIYHYLSATKEADADTFRTKWQSSNSRPDSSRETVIRYYQENLMTPKIDLAVLPSYSFSLQFTFTLAQPFISRDEQDFYIIDNPVRKDKVFGLPYIASTSWKGSLRAALWRLGYTAKDNPIRHLFGNDKETKEQEVFNAGCLHFFPTFFQRKSLEVINPQDRASRSGKQPILFESVPRKSIGIFTLLYVPFDLVGDSEERLREQVANELRIVATGLQAMLCTYGFGAKTSSGFGLAEETVSEGILQLRATEFEEIKEEVVTQLPVASAPQLPQYLETPQRLKPEYLTNEGILRERPEAELKKMKKSDKQVYDKAKRWWEREGKQLAEEAKEPKTVAPAEPETIPQVQQRSWRKLDFTSFEQLLGIVGDVGQKLNGKGEM